MSKDAKDSGVADGRNEDGPDYFGYYRCLVAMILSRAEESPLFNSSTSRGFGSVGRESKASDNLFSNGTGASLSDIERETLKALLRQSAKVLSAEVDEILPPVVKTGALLAQQRSKKEREDGEDQARKKRKHTHSLSATAKGSSDRDGTKLLGFAGDSELDKIMTKLSDELFARLEHMERELDELLDCVMSSCRTMSLAEKKQLQKTINGFPPRNLDRIVELVQRGKPVTDQNSSDDVLVDLERESNATLWRLYYHTEAVKKARMLCHQI